LSDRIASSLQSAGVAKGDRIGIYVPKSITSLLCIYSILKAGAAYVPFDPDAPPERLAFIARDCGIRTVLTCSQKKEGLNAIIGKGAPLNTALLIDLETEQEPMSQESQNITVVKWDQVRESSTPLRDSGSGETDTAYILYTSGSTGVPKGVMISHRNSLAFVEWAADCVGLSQKDVVACHAPLHFDISTFSIFSTCGAGGTVLVLPERASTFPVELASLIEREGVTVWYSVPSALTLLALYGNLQKRDLRQLRAVVFAGEVFPVKFLKQLMSLVPHARYWNWYGPTETNVCTSYEVTRLDDSMSTLPIGKACANTEVFALSDAGTVVRNPGETGELYVKGPTVMQGYWGDKEKTTRLLVTNPMNQAFDEKVYRTGDLVTLAADGNYLYLGRRDGMIKTRGYRVELGDIETAIYSHPAVKEVVVVPIPDDMVGNKLHAIISARDGEFLTKEEILKYCGSKLPKYMIPDVVSFMATLPKTSSGKMDRFALAQVLRTGG
jgi:amino acid adenylation domain-containing protein